MALAGSPSIAWMRFMGAPQLTALFQRLGLELSKALISLGEPMSQLQDLSVHLLLHLFVHQRLVFNVLIDTSSVVCERLDLAIVLALQDGLLMQYLLLGHH